MDKDTPELNAAEIEALLTTAFVSLGLKTAHAGLNLHIALDRVLDPDLRTTVQKKSDTLFPYFRLRTTQALYDYINENCIYKLGRPDLIPTGHHSAGEHYYLELLENGRLFVRYQQIIGNRLLGTLSEERMQALCERLKELTLAALADQQASA